MRHADRARTRLARTGLRGLADGVEPHEAEADAVPLDDRRPAGLGKVAARAERAQIGVGEPVDGLHQRRLAVVAGVVVRQRERVEARCPQALRHPRVGGERVAALGGGAVRRERALEVADGDVGGAEAALHRPERVRRVALRRGPLADPPAEHDVADHGQGGDPGRVRAGRPDRVASRVAQRVHALHRQHPDPGPDLAGGRPPRRVSGASDRSADGSRVTVSRPPGRPELRPPPDAAVEQQPGLAPGEVGGRTAYVHREHQRLGRGRVRLLRGGRARRGYGRGRGRRARLRACSRWASSRRPGAAGTPPPPPPSSPPR